MDDRDTPPRPQRPVRSRRGWARLLVLLALTAVVIGWVGWERCGVGGCPDVDRLGALRADGAPLLLDRHGEPLGTLPLADHVLVPLGELPAHVPRAFVAVEDKRFRQHGGIDWHRVGGALLANVRAGEVEEGSSTITMQLARNLFPERIPGQERTLSRKLLEMRVAREIEARYTKDEILELYLNHIYFGAGHRGIESASLYYFGHPASELTVPEAALLAGLPKAPTHYNPRKHPDRARERRDLVLDLMEAQGVLAPEEAAEARETDLGVAAEPRRARLERRTAPWFVERVREEIEERFGDELYRRPVRIVTTLDPDAQEAAEEELARQLAAIDEGRWGRFRGPRYGPDAEVGPEGTPYLQGAVVVVEARTGDVLAWVGGRDFVHSRFDRVADARRQVGSAFKPFLYAAAIAQGHPPTERLSDQPVRVRLSDGRIWEPKNFGNRYARQVSLREALVHSKNVATVRLATETGVDAALDLARRAGFHDDLPRVPSVVLGSLVASPLELVAAYTTFANLGEAAAPRTVLRVEDQDGRLLWASHPETRRVMSPAAAYVLTDILGDAVDRGTGHAVRAAGFRGPAAGKTGTTNEHQDAWFVGYTPDLVGAVWVGFDQPRRIVPGATGGRLAAPIWGRVMRRIYRERETPAGWPRPGGVVESAIEASTGRVYLARCGPVPPGAAREVFVRGYEPPGICGPVEEGWSWGRLFGGDETAPPAGATPERLPDRFEVGVGDEGVAADLGGAPPERLEIPADGEIRIEGEGSDIRVETSPDPDPAVAPSEAPEDAAPPPDPPTPETLPDRQPAAPPVPTDGVAAPPERPPSPADEPDGDGVPPGPETDEPVVSPDG